MDWIFTEGTTISPRHEYYYEYRYGPPDYRPYFPYYYYYDGPGVRIEIGPRGNYYRYQ